MVMTVRVFGVVYLEVVGVLDIVIPGDKMTMAKVRVSVVERVMVVFLMMVSVMVVMIMMIVMMMVMMMIVSVMVVIRMTTVQIVRESHEAKVTIFIPIKTSICTMCYRKISLSTG